jgi:hypothetical protein
MTHFYYRCSGWDTKDKVYLAKELEKELEIPFNADGRPTAGAGFVPFISVDDLGGLAPGVAVRQITHIPQDGQDKLYKTADRVYVDVCHQVGKKVEASK